MTEPIPFPVSDEVFIGTATVAGREMQVKTITDAQFMLLSHEATLLQNPNIDKARKIKGVDRAFRVLTSVIVNEDDVEFIEDQMADGHLKMSELATSLLDVQRQKAQSTGVQTQGPVKARRGRTTKSS